MEKTRLWRYVPPQSQELSAQVPSPPDGTSGPVKSHKYGVLGDGYRHQEGPPLSAVLV